MKPSEIKPNCVYDYRPPRAQGTFPCVWVDGISHGRVEFRWLEEDGGGSELSLALFAKRCTSRRDPQTWEPIAP